MPDFDEKSIDHSRIAFPSDKITLKHLWSLDISLDDDGEALEVMHMQEKQFAQLGFARASGDGAAIESALRDIIRWSPSDGRYDEERGLRANRDSLASDYVLFGIAEGPESAKHLIEWLESMGAEQARERFGRSPT